MIIQSRVGKLAMAAASAGATLAVVVGVVVAARSDSMDAPARSAPSASQDPWAWQTPDAAGGVSYNDIYTLPVPAGTAPSEVSSTRALDVATSLAFGDLAGGTPRATLRIASRPLDGRSSGSYRDRLAWIVEYPDSPMILSGPPGLSDKQRAQILADGVCEFVIVVDATTATPLTSMQVCRKRT